MFNIENFLSKKFDAEIIQPFSSCGFKLEKTNYAFKDKREKYFKYWIGGSDLITFDGLFQLKKLKADGIVQLRIFGCAPEEMVTLALEDINKKEKIPPVLTLTFDEHSSVEGLKTRLEAFCNTLLLKK